MRTKILKGSCHCRAVTFTVKSKYFYPYQLCYCSICRKTQGGGGYAINLSAQSATLKVKGKKYIRIYQATKGAERNFCSVCSSGLWLYSPQWPDLIHPFASVIDSALPKAPTKIHVMLAYKANWVNCNFSEKDLKYRRYPKDSIQEWHEKNL